MRTYTTPAGTNRQLIGTVAKDLTQVGQVCRWQGCVAWVADPFGFTHPQPSALGIVGSSRSRTKLVTPRTSMQLGCIGARSILHCMQPLCRARAARHEKVLVYANNEHGESPNAVAYLERVVYPCTAGPRECEYRRVPAIVCQVLRVLLGLWPPNIHDRHHGNYNIHHHDPVHRGCRQRAVH